MVLILSSYKIMLIQLIVTVIFVSLDIFLWKLGVKKYDGSGR